MHFQRENEAGTRLLFSRFAAKPLLTTDYLSGVECLIEIGFQIVDVLETVGLADKAKKMPHELSGGEQQRVCIARALLNNPDLILADEPTGNLDPITAEEIFQVFHHINKSGTTVLMATHNFNLINMFPSRTLLIEDGKILDSGV